MHKTAQEQVADLIELLALSGWAIRIDHSLARGAKPWRVEGMHPRYAVITASEAETLVDALAPFEEELPIASREGLRVARGELRFHAKCETCSYVGRSFAVKATAENDGDEHEIAIGTNLQHHHTRVVTEGSR